MYQIVFIFHILAAFCIIGLVLLQQGKGATIGAAFGSGASQTVFGSRGSGSFLLRLTIGFVVLFFATSMILANIASRSLKQEEQAAIPTAPVAAQPPAVTPSSIPDTMPAQHTSK